MTAETDWDVEESAPLGVYTETLARLYWRQGYLDKALLIYHHLAAEQPDNPHFQEQIHALEEQQELSPDALPPEPVKALRSEAATPVAVHQNQYVIDQLERWLHHLQRRRRL